MEEKTFFKEDWKAIEKIGEGSFGIVYKAEKVDNYGIKSYSAIKQILIPQSEKEYFILKSEGMTQSDIEKSYDNQAKKWIEEIKFLNQFKDNENIVSIEDFEVIERKDRPGRIINIRMELLQNIDDHVLDKAITDKKVLRMALDILNALEECEEKNVVHRDIKPDNVFVNTRGIYKLGDFGEAKSIEKTVSNMSKKGTENYMAPEIYKGERGSRSVDTYSLGIMLYKYFNNNRLPFLPEYPKEIRYEDRDDAIYKRMSGEKLPAPVKASNTIAKIILKACNYRPEDRYISAMEMKNEIEREYREIQTPLKLFDFQEDFDKADEDDSYEGTIGIFSNNSNKESSAPHSETIGIFTNNNEENEDDKEIEIIDNTPNYDEKEQTENIKPQKINDIPVKTFYNGKNKILASSIGIETYGGMFFRLFNKNTIIPTKKIQQFRTVKKMQESMGFTLLQRESNKAIYNKKIGTVHLLRIPTNTNTLINISVVFKIEEDGMLYISIENANLGIDINILKQDDLEMHELYQHRYDVPKGYISYRYDTTNYLRSNFWFERATYNYSNFNLEIMGGPFFLFSNYEFENFFELNTGVKYSYSSSYYYARNSRIKFQKNVKKENNKIEHIFWTETYIIKYTTFDVANEQQIYEILDSFAYNEKFNIYKKEREYREKQFEKQEKQIIYPRNEKVIEDVNYNKGNNDKKMLKHTNFYLYIFVIIILELFACMKIGLGVSLLGVIVTFPICYFFIFMAESKSFKLEPDEVRKKEMMLLSLIGSIIIEIFFIAINNM